MNVTLTGGVTATCPCDGDGPATLGTPMVTSTAGNATINGNVVTVPIGRSAVNFSVTVSVQASCDDLDDTTCAVMCSATIPINVTEQDEGNCRNVNAFVGAITSGCS